MNKNKSLFSSKINLNLGCGITLRKDFINIDKYYTYEQIASKSGVFKNSIVEENAKFIQADIKNLPFPDNYADYVELMNTIEHFPMRHVEEYIKEIYRVMKPQAQLIIMTNNMTGLAVDWIRMVTSNATLEINEYIDVAEMIYGNQVGESNGEIHRCPFTADFLNYILVKSGFKDGKLYIIPKGVPCPQIGTIPAQDPNVVTRNDLLIAEVIK